MIGIYGEVLYADSAPKRPACAGEHYRYRIPGEFLVGSDYGAITGEATGALKIGIRACIYTSLSWSYVYVSVLTVMTLWVADFESASLPC